MGLLHTAVRTGSLLLCVSLSVCLSVCPSVHLSVGTRGSSVAELTIEPNSCGVSRPKTQ